jgi:hypothetical protein
MTGRNLTFIQNGIVLRESLKAETAGIWLAAARIKEILPRPPNAPVMPISSIRQVQCSMRLRVDCAAGDHADAMGGNVYPFRNRLTQPCIPTQARPQR